MAWTDEELEAVRKSTAALKEILKQPQKKTADQTVDYLKGIFSGLSGKAK